MSEDKPFASSSSRHRSPVFTEEEVSLLLKLIEKYKFIIMNKSVRSSANQKKEEAWMRISRQFNKESSGVERSAVSLMSKWKNFKKETKKLYYNNVLDSDVDYSIANSVHAQIASLMSETHNYDEDDPAIPDDDEDDGNVKKESNGQDSHWIEIDKQEGEVSDEENVIGKKNRSSNFSSSECSLLLKCIREEKEEIFSKEITGKALELKNHAWQRVTASYNKLSPQKRSTKMLRTKFVNLKKIARRIGPKDFFRSINNKKHDKLIEDTKNIKTEPNFSSDTEDDWFNDCEDTDLHKSVENNFNFAPDPLSSVLNGDSGMGSSHTSSINSDNPEVIKLKLDLLHYQMETAKMERKRVEELIKEDSKTKESRATETAMRLRAARLDAIAAESRLSPSHPALHYPSEETPAQQYLNQYMH